MCKKWFALWCVILFVGVFVCSPVLAAEESSSGDEVLKRESFELDKARFAFEREKWEYEKAQKEKEEFEEQLPATFDYYRSIPTYEFVGYVSDTDRQNLLKVLTILGELGQNKLRLNISSFGGSAFDGMGVADTISKFKDKGFDIIGVAYGKIASAAVPIFVTCTHRIAGPSTMFMVHEASMFKFLTVETKSDIDSQQEMMAKLEDQYIKMLVKNSNKSAQEWEDRIRKTTWFTADEALEWGIVDKLE